MAAKVKKEKVWLRMEKNQQVLADFYLTRKAYGSKM